MHRQQLDGFSFTFPSGRIKNNFGDHLIFHLAASCYFYSLVNLMGTIHVGIVTFNQSAYDAMYKGLPGIANSQSFLNGIATKN